MTKKATVYLFYIFLSTISFPVSAQQQEDHPSAAENQEDESYPDGYFRIDTDAAHTQLWVGATHDLGGGVGLGSDIYVVDTFAELDVGISFSVGPVSLLPMVGVGFDFGRGKTASIIAPQLFTIIDSDILYFESWIQVFFNDMFTEGVTDYFYTRNFILAKIFEIVSLGPQVELEYDIKNAGDDKLSSLPVGGRVNIGYGKNNTLGLFLGYDTKTEHLAGRFTFVRTW